MCTGACIRGYPGLFAEAAGTKFAKASVVNQGPIWKNAREQVGVAVNEGFVTRNKKQHGLFKLQF